MKREMCMTACSKLPKLFSDPCKDQCKENFQPKYQVLGKVITPVLKQMKPMDILNASIDPVHNKEKIALAVCLATCQKLKDQDLQINECKLKCKQNIPHAQETKKESPKKIHINGLMEGLNALTDSLEKNY